MRTIQYSDITAGGENSIFVWGSAFSNSFVEMPDVTDDMIVVITNSHHPNISIYNVKGFTEEEIGIVIKYHFAYMASGCNYKYKLIKKTGNCYFIN